MKEKYLKASEIAKKYNVSAVSVKSWIKAGLFPNAKFEENIVGSLWLIPESDLQNFAKPERGRPRKSPEKVNEEAKPKADKLSKVKGEKNK